MLGIGLAGFLISGAAGAIAYLLSTDLNEGNKAPPELAISLFAVSAVCIVVLVAGIIRGDRS